MSVEINITNEIVEIDVTGGMGPAGAGVPVGGTTGQVLAKDSNDNYDTEWINLDLTGLVPYTGATTNVDLGEFELKAGQVEFDQTPTGTAGVGVMRWNDTDGTVDLGLKGGNVTLQVGQEQVLRVVNKTGADLLEAQYRAVRIRLVSEGGSQGQRLAVVLAQGDNDPDSTTTIGIVTETIANNQEGFITTSGMVRGINTTGSLQGETWADGDIIYLSPTVAGAITKVKPTAPDHSVTLGYVVYAHAVNGKIFVKVDNGYEIGELHDVYVPTPSNNDGIFWNTTNSRYQNNTIAGVLGFTPQAALTLTTTGTSGAATLVGATLNIPQYSGTNIYNADGTLTAARTLTHGGFNLSLVGSTHTNRFTSAGRLLLGTTSESTFLLDVNGTARVSGANELVGVTTFLSGRIASFFSSPFVGFDVSGAGWGFQIRRGGGVQFTIFGSTGAVNIGPETTQVSSSAALAVNANNAGFLPPRMTTVQRDAIATPATGLQVYNTTTNANNYYDGSAWVAAGSNIYTASGSLTSARTLTLNSQPLTIAGTTSSRFFANGNVGIGTTTDAGYKLDLNGQSVFRDLLYIASGNAIRGLGNFFIDGPGLSGTITMRANLVNIIANLNAGVTNLGGLTVDSGSNTVSLITGGAGVTSFRIQNTKIGGGTWYFENNRNAVAGSLEITKDIATPCITLFQSNNISIGSFTDNSYKLDINGTARVSGDFTIADTKNIILATGTGTKIGTSTSEKLSFWNATPIVQPTTGIAEAAFVENSGGTAVNVDSTFDGYTMQQVVKALRNMGALA